MNEPSSAAMAASPIPEAFGGPVGGGVAANRQHPMLDGLNEPQRQAVCLPAEHGLILAGAGSGKTRVLTTRIAWLMQTGQVSPQGILAQPLGGDVPRALPSSTANALACCKVAGDLPDSGYG